MSQTLPPKEIRQSVQTRKRVVTWQHGKCYEEVIQRSLRSPGGEGDDTPLQYSCLENPMDGGAWWAAVHGVVKSLTRLSDFPFTLLSCFGEGNGNPLQCSCLENPRDGGAWWAAIYGVTQSPTWLKWLSSSSSRSPGVSETAFWSKWSTRPCRVSGSQSQKERSAQCSGRGREPASLRVWGCPGKHTGRGWIWDKTKNGLVRAMEGVQNGHSSLGSSESRAGQRSWDSQSKPNGCRLYLEETSRFYILECNPQLFLCVCYIPSSMLSAYTF